MKTIYLTTLLCVFVIGNAYATSDNPTTKSTAMFIAAFIFFGIVGIFKLIKSKKE